MEKCFTEPKAIGSPPNAFKIAIEFLEKIQAIHALCANISETLPNL